MQTKCPREDSNDNSEVEIGQISESALTSKNDTVKDVDEIDQQMQQRIIELHDQMEESGLHGAVNLLEKLFDKKPGEDVPDKRKLKDKVRAGIAKTKVKSPKKGKLRKLNKKGADKISVSGGASEVTLYRNAMEKRTSSSSEDGLDISDESHMLNTLVLDAVESP